MKTMIDSFVEEQAVESILNDNQRQETSRTETVGEVYDNTSVWFKCEPE